MSVFGSQAEQRPPTVDVERIEDVEYGLLRDDEVETAAAIYLENFPFRLAEWFEQERHTFTAVADLLRLVRTVHGSTFLAARMNGRLAGYLALTLPGRSLAVGLAHPGNALRVGAHAVSGQYGRPYHLLKQLIRSVRGRGSDPSPQFPRAPHVYVVAIRPTLTGHGIGTQLLHQACSASERNFDRIWLNVERENESAIRFYRRHHFQIVGSDSRQHVMVRYFQTRTQIGVPM